MDKYYFGPMFAIVGVTVTGVAVSYITRPSLVYTKDINGDNRPDVIVRAKNGKQYLFLQQPDGSYLLSDEVMKRVRESSKAYFDSLETKLKQKAEAEK